MKHFCGKVMNKYIGLLLACCLIAGCTQGDKGVEEEDITEDFRCTCPPTIYLQPYNDFSQQEAKMLIPHLNQFLSDCSLPGIDIEVLPNIQLTDSLMNDKRTRYRADKMLKSLPEEKFNAVILLGEDFLRRDLHGRKDKPNL